MKSYKNHPDSKNLNKACRVVLTSKNIESTHNNVESLKYSNKPSDIYSEAKKHGFKFS